MQKDIVSTNKAPEAIGTYSQAVAVTGGITVYLSGQIPLVPEKYCAIISFTVGKWLKSVKKILSFTISFKSPPAAPHTALKFLNTW
jgi:enamine deaminase RidA (YjgF/YER057c/UK114 family)